MLLIRRNCLYLPIASASIALLAAIHQWIQHRQPAPYMDELFHIPQSQLFCTALHSHTVPHYHPSITTLPGLYLLPALVSYLFRTQLICTTPFLRAFSAICALFCLPLLLTTLYLTAHRHAKTPSNFQFPLFTYLSLAFLLWLHPVFLFYAHLFYTDTASLAAVLLTLCLALSAHPTLSAIAGIFSTFIRQTNMIWHAFIAFDSLTYHLFRQLSSNLNSLPHIVAALPAMLAENIPHILAALLYATFLIVNRGVAIGDKTNHQLTFHYAMIPYFLAFHAVSFFIIQLSIPNHLILQLRLLITSPPRMRAFAAINIPILALVLATGTNVHPFIMSDNRHFVFYIYRRWLLRSSITRICAVPIYSWAAFSCYLDYEHMSEESAEQKPTLRENADAMNKKRVEMIIDLMFAMCAVVTLVPSSLLEPRYFIVPNTLLSIRRIVRTRMLFSLPRIWSMIVMLLLVNLGLVFVFAELPFERPRDAHMPHDLSPGRFMF